MQRRRSLRFATVSALVVLAVGLLGVALGGCGAAGTTLPTGPVGITGSVKSLVPGDERPASMLVEGPSPQPAGAVSDKAQVTVGPSTQFFDAQGNATKGSGIKVGTQVKVWFDGPVAESYPVQGTAQAVQIVTP